MITVVNEDYEVMLALKGGMNEVIDGICRDAIEFLKAEIVELNLDPYRVNVYVDNDGMGTNGIVIDVEALGFLIAEVSLFDGDMYTKVSHIPGGTDPHPVYVDTTWDELVIGEEFKQLLVDCLFEVNDSMEQEGIVLS